MAKKPSLKNWYSEPIKWLNNLAYAGLATVIAIQSATLAGVEIDFLTDKDKRVITLCAIGFKFIEKLFSRNTDEPAQE